MRPSCASAVAPSAWVLPARVSGRVLHARFLGDLAVLEIAAEGFERPLYTLVRESDVPQSGQEVSITVDPSSVLVFPAEERRGDDAKLMPEASGNRRDSSV